MDIFRMRFKKRSLCIFWSLHYKAEQRQFVHREQIIEVRLICRSDSKIVSSSQEDLHHLQPRTMYFWARTKPLIILAGPQEGLKKLSGNQINVKIHAILSVHLSICHFLTHFPSTHLKVKYVHGFLLVWLHSKNVLLNRILKKCPS